MSDDTYDFDAMITVMANGDTKEEAADKILEHCMEADIACSLHGEGTLNVRSLTRANPMFDVEKRRPNWKKRQWIQFAELQAAEMKDMRKKVEILTTEGKIHKAVYDIIISRSHICSGRDCIGYLVEWNSATQLRCPSCQAICEALNPAQVGLDSDADIAAEKKALDKYRKFAAGKQ